MSNQDWLPEWNSYCIERKERWEKDEKDPLIQVRDILRQGTPGQYIWELLQNAEDAHATKVLISLNKDFLLFQHNGSKKFSLNDAKAITKVGFSGKIELPSIGQFGVGFKSVFRYAERVEIYEGNLRFALENYLKIINNIDPIKENIDNNPLTTFKIIFKKELQLNALKDSLEILESINHESLLFLENLIEINIKSSNLAINIVKTNLGDSRFKISTNRNNNINFSFWLLKTQPVTTELKDGNSDIKATRETYLGFAIKLQLENDHFQYVEVEKGKIFTYFPLEDQISNLKFHIHAPFVINLNRSMLDSNEINMIENNRLIKLLAILISSEILRLHHQKKLEDSLLKVLPIATDSIPTVLTPITQGIKQIFQSNQMVKVSDGAFANPEEIYQAIPETLEFIGDSGLELFNTVTNSKLQRVEPGKSFKRKYLLPKSKEARINAFLRHIGVADIDTNTLKDFFAELNFILDNVSERINATEIKKALITWLELKSDIKIRKLYTLLGRLEIPNSRLKNLPIFRTHDADTNHYQKVENVYLSTSLEQKEIDVLKSSIFFKNNVVTDNLQDLQNFFANLGLREKDEWVVFEDAILRSKNPESRDQEKDRIPYLLSFYLKDKNRFLGIVRDKICLVGEQFNSNDCYWVEPKNIFQSTNEFNLKKLNSLADESEREYTLWSGYSLTSDFENMIKDLGVNSNLKIDRDLDKISFLNTILYSKDLSLLIILWKFLKTLNYSDFFVRLHKMEVETGLFKTLKEVAWIPMQDGSFKTPYECDPSNLAKEFKEYSGVFFNISNFGRKLIDDSFKSEQENQRAKEAGFKDAEEMAFASQLLKEVPREELERLKKTDQMNEYLSIPDPQKEVDHSKNLERKRPIIERTDEIINTRITYEPAQEERKDQLRKIYGNASGDISCQMCHLKQMPFKTPVSLEGIEWDYFEAVALFTGINKESNVNAVALCPNCSAKMKNFRKNHSKGLRDPDIKLEIIRLKKEIEGKETSNSEIYFEFEILGFGYTMKFNKKHLLSLYAMLEVAKEN